MAVQWPNVAAGLVALLPTLPGWQQVSVFDGPPVSSDTPTDWVTVGFLEGDVAGTYTVMQDPSGFMYAEAGEVRCHLACNSGDTDLSQVRGRAFGLANALDTAIRGDRTLGGVLPPESSVELAVDVQSVQDPKGSAQALVLTVRYTTVT